MKNIKSLAIIDDCELWRTLIHYQISKCERLTISIGCSMGDDFFQRYDHYQFDMILLDISLPGTNGYEIALKLRMILPHIPIVIFTSSNDHKDLIWFSSVGVTGYINKSRYQSLATDLCQILGLNSAGHKFYNFRPLNAIELRLISLICSGQTNKEIAEILHTVEKNIEYKLKKICNSLLIPNNKLKIMEFAVKYGYW